MDGNLRTGIEPAQPSGRRAHAAIVLATFIVLVASACGSSQPPKPASNSAPKALKLNNCVGNDCFYTRISGLFNTGKGVSLKFVKADRDKEVVDCDTPHNPLPATVGEGSSATWCVEATQRSGSQTGRSEVTFDYAILNSSGQDSGYVFEGHSAVPFAGANQIGCVIKQKNVVPKFAPYRCDTEWGDSDPHSYDPQPHWKVTENPVTVVDASNPANAQQAADLIGGNCQEFDTPSCNWTRSQQSSVFLEDRKDWAALTNWADSCPPATKEFVLTATHSSTVSWSDTIGGKITAKMKTGNVPFFPKVEGSLEANYSHSISESDAYGEGYQYPIPLGYRSALYLEHGILRTTGDFSIATGDGSRYLIKNATFDFPLAKDAPRPDGRGQPIPRGIVVHTDVKCDQPAPANGVPPPANARVGVATLMSH